MVKKCINCGVSNVPLHIGLDGHWHCKYHVQILVGAGQLNQKEVDNTENTEEKVHNG